MKKEYYLQFVTGVEKMSDWRTCYHIGDNFIVEIIKCEHNLKDRGDLMNRWKGAGYIKETLPTHIAVDTFFTDADGFCWGWYNPYIKKSEDGKRRVINFDLLREYTEENVAELVAECIRMREMNIRE